jgi:hypothetical protein
MRDYGITLFTLSLKVWGDMARGFAVEEVDVNVKGFLWRASATFRWGHHRSSGSHHFETHDLNCARGGASIALNKKRRARDAADPILNRVTSTARQRINCIK